jgi:hypothetical protein
MATNRKPKKTTKKKTVRRTRPRKSEQLNKLETHYITLNEIYKAAIAGGFSREVAYWLITEPGESMPDWVIPKTTQIIPTADPYEDDED